MHTNTYSFFHISEESIWRSIPCFFLLVILTYVLPHPEQCTCRTSQWSVSFFPNPSRLLFYFYSVPPCASYFPQILLIRRGFWPLYRRAWLGFWFFGTKIVVLPPAYIFFFHALKIGSRELSLAGSPFPYKSLQTSWDHNAIK